MQYGERVFATLLVFSPPTSLRNDSVSKGIRLPLSEAQEIGLQRPSTNASRWAEHSGRLN
jgi:hypothetical protein